MAGRKDLRRKPKILNDCYGAGDTTELGRHSADPADNRP